MAEYGVHEAKTQLSKLLERALAGEEVIVTRSGEPLVQLVPVQRRKKPNPGWAAGTVTISDDFDEPMPDWFMDHFR
ncbi:MAG TPA: type II toxin-antitoxin system Phd/YefM family antitoxin [Pseudonocardia sp.]|jgi:prevent-host-death family protein|nr:type II toxin-antitoxin system Phd/YefM family antitoxin [Pseudonocardia sp.]